MTPPKPGTTPVAQETPYDPYNPVDQAIRDNPYPVYRELREKSPIHWSPRLNMWLLTRYREIFNLARDPRFSAGSMRVAGLFARMTGSDRAELQELQASFGNFILFMDPPRHTRIRSTFNRAFTPVAVERLRPAITTLARDLVDAAAKRGEIDIIRDLAYPLPVLVIGEMLGIPPSDRELLKGWSDHIAHFIGNLNRTLPIGLAAQTAVREMGDYIRALIARRRERPTEDLLSDLVRAEENGKRLDTEELVSQAILLLTAGHETTSNLIGNGTLALLRHPAELERLRREPALMPLAVDELLRYDGAVQYFSRVALQDVAWENVTFRAGQLLLLMVGAANRDPEQFENPERLDVGRTENRHVAFGQGIHFCPGAPLARLEGQIAFRTLLDRFPRLSLASETIEWRMNLGLRGLKALPVRTGD